MSMLDRALLEDAGLGELPDDCGAAVLRRVHDLVERRVGMRIAAGLDEEQLGEFEDLMEDGDEAGALAWLERTCPGYRDIVRAELERARDELRTHARRILGAVGSTCSPS